MSKKLLSIAVWLAARSAQTPFEVPGKDSTSTAIYIDSCYTADCTNCDYKTWVISTGGYVLSQIEIWPTGSTFKGIRLTYKDANNNVLVGNVVGETSGVTVSSIAVTKQVVGVTMKQAGPHTATTKQPQSGLILHFADSTTLNVGPVVASDTSFYSSLNFGLLGLRCNFH